MPNYCGASGPKDARIAIIGEAPGKNELLEGQPFVGASGKLLWQLLKRLGVQRQDVYCTNVIKVSAPQSPLTALPWTELENWKRILQLELQQLEAPTLYLALGETALWALTAERGIHNWRGSILEAYNGIKTIATRHPAALLYDPSDLHKVMRDLKFAVGESLSPGISLPETNYKVYPSLREALQHIAAAKLQGEIAFDIETAKGGICTCISIAFQPIAGKPNCSMSIPMHGVSYWTVDEYFVIYTALQQLLGSSQILKIGQNVSYDIIGLRACGIEVKPPYEDTMHFHHSIDPLAPHSLAFQASYYTRYAYWKEWETAPESSGVTDLFEYNAKDSDVTLELHRTYHIQFPHRIEFYNQRYKVLHPHLIQMYEDGICIDAAERKRMATELRTYAKRYETAIAKALQVPEFNVNSHTQVKHMLYDVLDMPKQYRRKGHQRVLTSDDEAIIDIYLATQNPFVLMLRDAKEQYKLVSFLEPSSKDAQAKRKTWDGKLRCEYKPTTETGRLSSSASVATRTGINLQQIPPIVRRVFIPSPGYIFIEPDYSQIQARIVAWDSCDDAMMDYFNRGITNPKEYDIHWYNAQLILEQPREALRDEDRNCCKHVVYGSFFDMLPYKLQSTVLKYTDPPIFIDLDECRRRQNVFKSKVPKFQERQERIKHEVLTTGQQVSPTGRIVTYHDIIYDDLKYCFGRRDYSETIRSAYAMVPQDLEAYMVNKALCEVDDALRERKLGRVAIQVHDSLLCEVVDTLDTLVESFNIMKELMEVPFMLNGEPMVVPIECKLGYSWAAEEYKIRTVDELITSYKRIQVRRIR